jgi:hypothetical protein
VKFVKKIIVHHATIIKEGALCIPQCWLIIILDFTIYFNQLKDFLGNKMDMDQTAVWLAGSILITLGFVVVIAGVIVVNNILHKYWKPVRIFTADSWNLNPPSRFITPEDMNEIKNKETK